jgi:hypothetical protein
LGHPVEYVIPPLTNLKPRGPGNPYWNPTAQRVRPIRTPRTEWLVKNCRLAQDGERLGLPAMEIFEQVYSKVVNVGGFKESNWREIKTVLRAADHFADAYVAQLKEWVKQREHEEME